MFYIELKKREPNFTRYPLCLTIGESNAQDTITSTRSGTSDYHKDTWGVPENIKSMTLYPPQGRVRVGRAKKRKRKASWEIYAKQHEQVKCESCNQYRHD